MCEIYGYSGIQEKFLNEDLREFYSHAVYHPNGWGLALFGKKKTEILREVCRADCSCCLKNLLAKPLFSQNALAHIRLATIGNEEYDNCHPFTATDNSGRQWTLIHNGTIFESKNLGKYIFRQKGETDSERILLYLVDCINDSIKQTGHSLSAKKRFEVLDNLICHSSSKNKLNLLIYDGETMYVHTNFKNSLYMRKEKNGITFSTRPLSHGIWKNVKFTTLLGCQNGELVFTGTNHGNEYFFDADSYKSLYLAYANL